MREPSLLEPRDDLVCAGGVDGTGGEVVPAAHDAAPRDLDERDGLGIAGLEAHRRAGRDVEAAAVRELAVEGELGVRLDEVVVAAHLDRAIPSARDRELDAAASRVERHALALHHEHRPRGTRGVVGGGRVRREGGGGGQGQEAAVEGLGEVPVGGGDGVVHGHEVRAGGERALDHDLVQRAHDGREHVAAAQHRGPDGHEVRHRVLAIADELLQVVGDEGLDRWAGHAVAISPCLSVCPVFYFLLFSPFFFHSVRLCVDRRSKQNGGPRVLEASCNSQQRRRLAFLLCRT